MRVPGKLTKSGRWWAVEVPALRIFTQGATRKEALEMAEDAVRAHADEVAPEGFCLTIDPEKGESFAVVSADDRGFLAFILARTRQGAGLSIRQVGERIGLKSHTAYARYERGEREVALSTFESIIDAMVPGAELTLSIKQ